MIHFIYFNSCHFHHWVSYELTMACSSVSLISSMNRALHPVIANIGFDSWSSLNFFQKLLRLSIQLQESFPLSYTSLFLHKKNPKQIDHELTNKTGLRFVIMSIVLPCSGNTDCCTLRGHELTGNE